MAEPLQNYESGAKLYFKSKLLGEIEGFQANDSANNTDVLTTTKGLAGWAGGPQMSEISWDSFIPKAGMEADYAGALARRENCTVRVVAGGVTDVYTVRLDSVDRTFNVSNAAKVAVKTKGKRVGATT